MQLKNQITDIMEQKQKNQEINDMLIKTMRDALSNQASAVSTFTYGGTII